jgi:hypothetical protein
LIYEISRKNPTLTFCAYFDIRVTVVFDKSGVSGVVMLNRENENIGYREPNIGYSIV